MCNGVAVTVNIFVDRDMFMRYLGGGVGHQDALGESLVHDTPRSDLLSTEGIDGEDHEDPNVEEEIGWGYQSDEHNAGQLEGDDSDGDLPSADSSSDSDSNSGLESDANSEDSVDTEDSELSAADGLDEGDDNEYAMFNFAVY